MCDPCRDPEPEPAELAEPPEPTEPPEPPEPPEPAEPPEADAPAWLEAAFLEELLVCNSTTPVDHYHACFPGHECTVARLHSIHAGPASGRQGTPRDRRPVTTARPVASTGPKGARPAVWLGRYRLDSVIGQGAQGTVHLAYDPELDRHVAIKVGRAGDGDDVEGRLRLIREARVGARLEHPGLCSVLDHGVASGIPYVVMPFLDGWSLRRLLDVARGETIDPADAAAGVDLVERCGYLGLLIPGDASTTGRRRLTRVARLLERVATALAAAHGAGVVHRDLKPANILVRPGGEPVILDLGLARDQSSSLPSLTGAGDLVGTPAYVAPEQLRPRGRVGPSVDVWALGVVLYECLTGSRPFTGASREQLYHQILDGSPRPLRDCIGPVPRDLQVLVDVALQKDPGRRYATAAEFAEDLRRFADQLPIRARAPGPLARLALWSRRKPALAATAVGLQVSLVAAVVAMVGLLREQEHSSKLAAERHMALRAVSHDIVFDLVKRLRTVPGTARARRALAERALEYLDILHREDPGDSEIRQHIAEARLALGDALGSAQNQHLGEPSAALIEFERARDILLALPPGVRTDPEARVERLIVDSENRLGSQLISLGRFADAQAHLLRTRDHRAARAVAGGTLDNLEHLFGVLAELSECARQLGEPERRAEFEAEAFAVAARLTARADLDDPDDFERVAQTMQVVAVLHERRGDPAAGVAVLREFGARVVAMADAHPGRERLQHSAIVFGRNLGRMLLATGEADPARRVYRQTLDRLDRAGQDGIDASHRRLRLHVLFEFGRGLADLGSFEAGLAQLAAARAGCDAVLAGGGEFASMRKLQLHIRMATGLAHSTAGHREAALAISRELAEEVVGLGAAASEAQLRDRAHVMLTRVQVLATARDYAAARRVLERELAYFGGHRTGDARDQTRDAMRAMVARTRDKLVAFLRESGR